MIEKHLGKDAFCRDKIEVYNETLGFLYNLANPRYPTKKAIRE
jgi:hypothetical protein